MSLIGDALRKARQEASERESDRKGVLFSAKIANGPNRSGLGLGLGLVLGALIAVVATVAGGSAVWWVLNQRPPHESSYENQAAPPSVAGSGTASATETATGSASASESATETAVDPDPVPEFATASESAAATGTSTVSATASEAATALEIDPAPDPDAMNPRQASAPDTGFIGNVDGADVYLMEADLGEVTLSLDFLIFRTTDPFAEINGVEVHVGGIIAGFRVKDIERDRVVLSDGRKTIVLRAP